MPKILNTTSIYYNDCNLIAQIGSVKSRSDIPKELDRIIVSPMMAVVGQQFAIASATMGLTVCLHRFGTPESQRDIYEKIDHHWSNIHNTKNVFCSIGLEDIERVKYLENFSRPRNWCLDIANGYIPHIGAKLVQILNHTKIDNLIIGNIHSLEGFDYLSKIGKQCGIKKIIIRTGIAGGSPCSTSDMSGINRGNITEIMDCYQSQYRIEGISHICADGGIKNGNYASKAFAAGSEYIMLGGYWMDACEAESNLNGNGTYWGGASHKQQLLTHGKIIKHSEGKEIKVKRETRLLKELVDDLWGGISSYVSYSGYNTLSKAIGNGVFELKENSLPPKNRN